VLQYVGHVALFSGSKEVRRKAKEDMEWLFDQLEGPVYVGVWEERDERTVVDIPANCIGYIAVALSATLGAMEEVWGVLMFFLFSARPSRRASSTILRPRSCVQAAPAKG